MIKHQPGNGVWRPRSDKAAFAKDIQLITVYVIIALMFYFISAGG